MNLDFAYLLYLLFTHIICHVFIVIFQFAEHPSTQNTWHQNLPSVPYILKTAVNLGSFIIYTKKIQIQVKLYWYD